MSNPHDREILNHIFNPLLPLNNELVQEEEIEEVTEIIENDENTKRSLGFEVEGVREAERAHFDEAIRLFSLAIDAAPQRASGYNNRAQAHRLVGNVQRKYTSFH